MSCTPSPHIPRRGPLAAFVLIVNLVAIAGCAPSTPSDAPPSTSESPRPSPEATIAQPSPAIPSPSAAADTCVLPDRLPAPAQPVAGPVVDGAGAAALFTSYLYLRASSDALVARDDPTRDWAVGLWFRPISGGMPVLLAAPEDGMVVPLALSPHADVAAVWWLPARHGPAEPACPGGIYVLATDGTSSRLVTSADWSVGPESDQATWADPTKEGRGRQYLLPEASLSPDGRFLALIEPQRIRIFNPDPAVAPFEHVGSCGSTAWSPAKTIFVAGCEDMTSAWLVQPNGPGLYATSLALPFPTGPSAGWGSQPWTRSVALTARNDIRVARFFGFATGCETPGCSLPPLGYAVTTLHPANRQVEQQGATVKFIVEAPPRFSADASWLYVDLSDADARVLVMRTGAMVRTSRLGDPAGASSDGSRLFGTRLDTANGGVIVDSLDRSARHRKVLQIGWPAGATTSAPVILTTGLRVAAPS